MIAMLVLAASVLLFAGASSVIPFAAKGYWNAPGAAAANTNNPGAHGLTEILYAYASGTGNNGSAFAGITANTPWYNLTIGFAMLIGRFMMLLPLLAIAGSLAEKKQVPVSAGTFPTHGPLFVGLLVGVVVIVGALTYFPVLSLGPIVEHLML
jgi:K+-transporting ATPase ATPase A chain